jgi:Protein of unknown function (DUF1592)/Protein of unknown function (DUF1588)/Protein of unknown function (DUF1595)/Protein of unknown function (DUF1585)/Protein of unknown function (DUF1587)
LAISKRRLCRKTVPVVSRAWLAGLAPCFIALAACTGVVDPNAGKGAAPNGASGSGNAPNAGAGTGGSSTPAGSNTGAGGAVTAADCKAPIPTRAPMRRLTRFEYNNTVADLKLDTTNQAVHLGAEIDGNGFGNDADNQPVSDGTATAYKQVAEDIAAALTAPDALSKFLPCAANIAPSAELACVRGLVEDLLPKAYRRPLEAGEADEVVGLFQTVRSASTFAKSVASVIEFTLQSPDFLYRPELGTSVAGRADLLRPTGTEMATRLSYFLWGTLPDDSLRTAAAAHALDTTDGVRNQATLMLADPRARKLVTFFFDNLLPIANLAQLERPDVPEFTSKLGAAMRQETENFLEHVIFEGEGTWPAALTADYTYVNEDLAKFYGMTGVTGTEFRKVSIDTTKRRGLLSQAGMVAGPLPSNKSNPVTRGGFIVKQLLCQNIPLPTGALADMVKTPPDDPTKTARQRFTNHSTNPVCQTCHINMDPVGFGFENYDPIGRWRDTDQNLPIDASGNSPILGKFSGPTEFAQRMAESTVAQTCLASHWVDYAYGRKLPASGSDDCSVLSIQSKFKESGYNVQKLLISVTESDAFNYLPAVRE